MEKILKAKPLIKDKYSELKVEINELAEPLIMKVIRLGDDKASAFYVQNILNQGKKLGVQVDLITLEENTPQSELVDLIVGFNTDNTVAGIMLQKPLPPHIHESEINSLIKSSKDVDGFHPENLGKLMLEQEGLFPCTATACLTMLDYYNIETEGKNIVIIGRSAIVGKPLANMLLRKDKTGNATVTVCHSKTNNIKEITKQADILIAAIGKANYVTKDFLKNNCIAIDVGINEVKNAEGNATYVGDIDYQDVFDSVSAITPVPGGIGSVTTYELFKNLLKSKKIAKNK
ncbi:bifunctional 5,10-methylenetetrahydrofolate dehydrogenase/5,10-methenyltetrahydrofolate cyclohydrolase [bacterium]|nr:bifunctional 5,10-methylenetetrahydrofolate dehydrogenase/5,10-methenyltetrahydrofolate cyclohydrolase [bacterium]